jgi:2-amino-4-hydroxy-6-hydroxymethyldihydropteridine diphosphokinase
MSTAVLSIGSNVGDRLGHLQSAVDAMRPWLRAVSPVYETEPWGPVVQDDYLNAVLVVADADARPADWLDRAQAAERAAGRTRDTRWGPRTLDVDVVTVDDFHSDDPELTLPHPQAAQRAFVLVPWLDVNPEARLGERAVRDLLADVPSGGIHPRPDLAVA